MTEQTPTPTIERAYRVRGRLSRAQRRMLRRLLGAKRRIWNWALTRKDEAHRADGTRLNWIALSREFTLLKATPETAWLGDLPREPFNQVLRDFDRAWVNFFAGRARRPRRKKFGSVEAVRFTLDQRRDQVDREGGYVSLPGLGRVRFRVTEAMTGRLRSVTIRLDGTGRVFLTFTADGVEASEIVPAARDIHGVDVGMKSLAVTSSGLTVDRQRLLKEKTKRLRRYQRSYSRKMTAAKAKIGLRPKQPIPKGARLPVSNRMVRQRRKIGVLHARIADARRDYQHQASRIVVNGAEITVLEDLNTKGLCRSLRRGFRRSVHDAALGELHRQIEYKARWAERQVVKVDRFFPSSKTCSACGHVHADLKLKDRRWVCPACGAEHDRDLNAAKNIEAEGRRILNETSTARSAGIDARGEGACATGRTPLAGQPTSLNREEPESAARRIPSSNRKERL